LAHELGCIGEMLVFRIYIHIPPGTPVDISMCNNLKLKWRIDDTTPA
jgi:hypothetical protein